jgi:hypothetical protein
MQGDDGEDIPVRCACGKLSGTLLDASRKSGTRLFCYCSDCQAFARFLERYDEIVDEWGGTDLFQTAPSKLRIDKNEDDALACVRLSEKGMHRWYCRHCKTPVGNTMKANMPFVGIVHSFMHPRSSDRDAAIGKPLAHVQKKFAKRGGPPGTSENLPRIIGRTIRLLGTWWIKKAGKPSPFFHDDGNPRSSPRILTSEERSQLSS